MSTFIYIIVRKESRFNQQRRYQWNVSRLLGADGPHKLVDHQPGDNGRQSSRDMQIQDGCRRPTGETIQAREDDVGVEDGTRLSRGHSARAIAARVCDDLRPAALPRLHRKRRRLVGFHPRLPKLASGALLLGGHLAWSCTHLCCRTPLDRDIQDELRAERCYVAAQRIQAVRVVAPLLDACHLRLAHT